MNEKETLIERIQNCTTAVFSRWGFGWKGAEWHKTTKDKLVATLKAGNFAHYDVFDDVNGGLGIAFYSANDML